MNSKNEQENEKNPEEESNINNNYIKSKYDSLNSWLDNEDSKYSLNKENNELNKLNSNNDNDITKKDILSNINKLIEENDKRDQNFIYNKNRQILNSNPDLDEDEKFNNLKKINTSDILGLTLELKEIKKTNQIMKETIQDLKNEISRNELQYKENIDKALNKQKFEYEEQIEELKALIDNLISEKKQLNDKISIIFGEFEKKEYEYKKKINDLKAKTLGFRPKKFVERNGKNQK